MSDKKEQAQQQSAPVQQTVPIEGQGSPHSINEPPGSTLGANIDPGEPPPEQAGPPVLSALEPDSMEIGIDPDFLLTATGEFVDGDVIVFDNLDMATTYVDAATLTARAPMSATPTTIDVEVSRGEELSDTITFDFVAPVGMRSAEKRAPARKPSKGKRKR